MHSSTLSPRGKGCRATRWLAALILAAFAFTALAPAAHTEVKRPRNRKMRAILARARRDKEAQLKLFKREVRRIARQSKDEAQFQNGVLVLLFQAEDAINQIKGRALRRLATIAQDPQDGNAVIGAAGGDLSRALCALLICCKCAAAEMNEAAARLQRANLGGKQPLVGFVILPPPPIIILPPAPLPPKPIKITSHMAIRFTNTANSGTICVNGTAEPGTVIDIDLTCGGQSCQAQVTADKNCKWQVSFSGINGPINCTFVAKEQGNPKNNDSRTIGSC